jgi:hypothetical protein
MANKKQIVFFRDKENTKTEKQKEGFAILQVSKEAHKALKVYCAENGMILQYVASSIIKEFLKTK